MIEIRKARDGEEHQVLDFYYQLVDTMKGTPYCPKWEKGVYPVLSDIAGAIGANTLYVATENHEIIGAFILNHSQGEGYQFVNWQTKNSDDRIAVLHLLATAPACQEKGVGKKLLGKAVEVCKNQKDIAIRLDTLPWNVPGKRLYENFGFQYKGDVELNYPSTGKIAFSMYEYVL